MAQPLPDGWVDVGSTGNVSLSATVSVMMPWCGATINSWSLDADGLYGAPIHCDPPAQPFTNQLVARGEWVGYSMEGLLDNVPYCAPGFQDMMSNSHAFTENSGPYRLGMRYRLIDPSATEYPQFAQRDYMVEYEWFLDEDTQFNTSISDFHSPTLWAQPSGNWGVDRHPGMTPRSVGNIIGILSFGGGSNLFHSDTPTVVIKFTSLSCGASFDLSGLDDGFFKGSGDSANATYDPATGINHGGGSVWPPVTFTEDVDVTKFGESTTGAHLKDADGQLQTVPLLVSRSVPNAFPPPPVPSISTTRSFEIDKVWAAAQLVAFRDDDRQVPLMLGPRSSNDGSYYPVGLTATPELNLLRPDGNRPSDWQSSDSAKITVTENSTSSVFHIIGTGAVAARTLTGDWKKRVGLGPLGTSDPAFGIEEYCHTKHESGEDIYAWDLYTQMEMDITAPGTDTLTVQVDGNYLSIYDPHTTGSDRITNYTVSEVPFSYQYEIRVSNGRDTYYVDLCFPTNTGGPVYPSRIDKVTISGFSHTDVDYTLNEWELEARGNVYVKFDFGPPVQREDYSAMIISIDGSFGFGNLPDFAFKSEEIGSYGGGIRYVSPLEGAETGVIMDRQLSLAEFWGYLDKIEGLHATYYSSISDAALKDGFGNALGPELAQWLRPVVPHAVLTPNVEWRPPCSLQCLKVSLANGHNYTIKSQWNAGHGAIEMLVGNGEGGRAEPGIELTAGFNSYGVTDSFGYAVVTPVPANGTRTYGISQHP